MALISGKAFAAGLIVNELSNGTSGSREFWELLVVGDSGAPATPIDLNGWIFDDNNGDWSGAGIASGYMRFNTTAPGCTALQSVAPGSIIVVYNNGSSAIPSTTKNLAITAPDDLNDSSPADGVFIVPNTSDCVEGYNAPAYTGALGTSSWNKVGLRNAGDTGQVRTPAGVLFHGLSFGDVGDTTVPANGIDIADGGASGLRRNYFLSCGDWFQSTSFSDGDAATQDSPGEVNNAANAILIERIRAGFFDYDDLSNLANCTVLPAMATAVPAVSLPALMSLVLALMLVGERWRRLQLA